MKRLAEIGRREYSNQHCFLDILKCELVGKVDNSDKFKWSRPQMHTSWEIQGLTPEFY